MMHILNILNAIKNESNRALYLKTIIDESNLLKENGYYSMKQQKIEGLPLFETKLRKNTRR